MERNQELQLNQLKNNAIASVNKWHKTGTKHSAYKDAKEFFDFAFKILEGN